MYFNNLSDIHSNISNFKKAKNVRFYKINSPDSVFLTLWYNL